MVINICNKMLKIYDIHESTQNNLIVFIIQCKNGILQAAAKSILELVLGSKHKF